jgi:hypothetical protein
MLIASAYALSRGSEEEFYTVNMLLQRFQAGCFYVLKWALKWCPERSALTFTDEMIHEAQDLGSKHRDAGRRIESCEVRPG